jgi:hypothetical protein
MLKGNDGLNAHKSIHHQSQPIDRGETSLEASNTLCSVCADHPTMVVSAHELIKRSNPKPNLSRMVSI